MQRQDTTNTDKKIPDQLFTIEEVVERLKITRQFLHKLTKEKGIQVIKLGTSVRYSEEHIAKLLEQSTAA